MGTLLKGLFVAISVIMLFIFFGYMVIGVLLRVPGPLVYRFFDILLKVAVLVGVVVFCWVLAWLHSSED